MRPIASGAKFATSSSRERAALRRKSRGSLQMKRSAQGIAVLLVAVMLSAWAWSELYLHSQNTLCQNGRWISSKLPSKEFLVRA